MPNTGLFYLLEVNFAPCSRETKVSLVRADCNSCHHMFTGREEPELHPIGASGAVLTCPRCGSRQAISGARFLEFLVRFPCGYPSRSTDASLLSLED
jgi:hypothetical protein